MHPNDGRVVSNFIVHALEGRPITIYGDGSQTRSFCYVDDTVDGLIRLMNSPDEVTGPVNIGNPNEMSVKALAQQIIEQTGSKAELELCDLPADDPKQRQPDIARARELLGWEPRVPLKDGLERTIAYFREFGSDPQGGRQPR
jgi:UDP-glucuronate decarboxylase